MMGTTGNAGTPELNVVTLEMGRRLLADWRKRGVELALTDDDKLLPSRRLTAAEMGEMQQVVISTAEAKVTARDAIFEALRQEWLAETVLAIADLPATCAYHPDRDVYRYSDTGVAECEECALFGPEVTQAPLPTLDTTAPVAATTTPLRGAQGYAERGL